MTQPVVDFTPIDSGGGTIDNAQLDAVSAAIGYDADYSGLSIGTTNDNSAALNALFNANAGGIITLPEGDIVVDGVLATTQTYSEILSVPAGTTVRGSGSGTTITFRNPRPSALQTLMRLYERVTLENLTIRHDPATPPTAYNCFLVRIYPDSAPVLGTTPRIADVKIRNCKIYGPGQVQSTFLVSCVPLAFYYAKNTVIEDSEIMYSSGSAFGIEAIGCDGLFITRSRWEYNAQDGIKAFGSATYGTMTRLVVSGCQLNYNGQVLLQGQTVGTVLTDGGAIPNAQATGTRYRLNAANPSTIRLPTRSSVPDNTRYLVAKTVGSAPVTFTIASGDSTTLTGSFCSGNAIAWNGTGTNAGDRHVLHFLASAGAGWVSTEFGNGEGFDGTVSGALFLDCEAIGNDSSGFQIKNDNVTLNKAADISFVGCRASDSIRGNGFGIVCTGGTSHSAIQGINFTDCEAVNNAANGLILNSQTDYGTLGLITGVSITNFMGRSNRGIGLYIQPDVSDVMGTNIRLLGNGYANSQWNMALIAARNVKIHGLYMCGVDPIAVGANNEAAIDAASPSCSGLYLLKSSGSLTMAGVQITGFTARRHGGNGDIGYYTSGGQGTAQDFATVARIDRYPYWVDMWQAAAGTGTLIGDPLGNIIEDRTKENQGIISGAYAGQENRLAGIMSHRWIFGGYDNTVREAIATYLFGANHTVVMPSASGHSFLAGGGTNTFLTHTGECAAAVAAAGGTLGKSFPSVISSRQSSAIGHFSSIRGSSICSIGSAPDLVNAGKSGLVTSTTLSSNPQFGETLTANGTAYTQSATVTFTDSGSNDVVAWTGHGLAVGDIVQFSGGTPPSPVLVGVNYYVVNVSDTTANPNVGANAFAISATRGGTPLTWTGAGSPTTTGRRMNVVLVACDTATVSFTDSGSNDVVALAAHGLKVGDKIRFLSGTVPAALALGTDYYVQNTGNTTANPNVGANAFAISATYSGAALTWTGTGSAIMRKPTNSKAPLEFLISSVGGSDTSFIYNAPSRSTFNTYAPALAANSSWVAVPLGYSDDSGGTGYNVIDGSYLSHIERGDHNRMVCGWNSRAVKHFLGSLVPRFSDLFGEDCEINSQFQAALGFGARPFNPTQRTVAGGYVAHPGDMQYSHDLFMHCATTTNVVTDFKTQAGVWFNSWSGTVYLPPNTVWCIEGQVVAKNGMTDFKTWTFKATVKGVDVGGFSSVTIMSFTNTVDYNTAGAATWDWSLNNGGAAFGTSPGTPIYNFIPQVVTAAAVPIKWALHASFSELAT